MSDPIDAVLRANASFYQALASADFTLMSSLWDHTEAVACVHPGWPLLVGWAAVAESWGTIFRNQGSFRIWPSDVLAHVSGTLAWVTCVENIEISAEGPDRLVQVQATNVFHDRHGAWKMVHHHASHTPSRGTARRRARFSAN